MPGEGREERGEGKEKRRREGGVRDGEERKGGLSPKGHNYIHSAKVFAPSYDTHV